MAHSRKWTSQTGGAELVIQGNRLLDAIEAEALLLAQKDNCLLIEPSHVKKAVKKVTLKSNCTAIRVVIALSLSVLLPIALYQMATVPTDATIVESLNLFLLPVITIAWAVILVLLFREGV